MADFVAHCDETQSERAELGELASTVTDLGTPAGSAAIGVTRWQVDQEGDRPSVPLISPRGGVLSDLCAS